MADTRQVVSWALERKCAFRSGEQWSRPDRTYRQLADLRTVASAEGDGRIVNGICVTSWTTERDNAGNFHSPLGQPASAATARFRFLTTGLLNPASISVAPRPGKRRSS